MKTQHTPGPWHTERNSIHAGSITCVHGCRNLDWIEIWAEVRAEGCETREADAQLICAAPDMLAALKELRDCISETRGRSAWEAVIRADAAIAKAEKQ